VASYKQKWVRAQRGGIVHMQVELGDLVVRGQPLAVIADPMGESEFPIRAPGEGYVIGGITNPLVHRGDAVLHIAMVESPVPKDTELRSQLDKPASDASETMQLPAEPANGPAEGGKS
jgi:hypothetical protein